MKSRSSRISSAAVPFLLLAAISCASIPARTAASPVSLETVRAGGVQPAAPGDAPPARFLGRGAIDGAATFVSDATALMRAPAHWDAADWRRNLIVVTAIGSAFAVDQQVVDAVQRSRTSTTDQIARAVKPIGGARGLQLAAATFLAGSLMRNERWRDTGRDAVESSILAGGIITPLIKRVAGRERPNRGDGAYDFDPGAQSESFPSGHTTNAFAIASVFAAHSHGWIVPAIAYTLAGTIAASRVNDDVHFASDVLAGAVIGTAVGRTVVARHHREACTDCRQSSIDWQITPVEKGAALELSLSTGDLMAMLRRMERKRATTTDLH